MPNPMEDALVPMWAISLIARGFRENPGQTSFVFNRHRIESLGWAHQTSSWRSFMPVTTAVDAPVDATQESGVDNIGTQDSRSSASLFPGSSSASTVVPPRARVRHANGEPPGTSRDAAGAFVPTEFGLRVTPGPLPPGRVVLAGRGQLALLTTPAASGSPFSTARPMASAGALTPASAGTLLRRNVSILTLGESDSSAVQSIDHQEMFAAARARANIPPRPDSTVQTPFAFGSRPSPPRIRDGPAAAAGSAAGTAAGGGRFNDGQSLPSQDPRNAHAGRDARSTVSASPKPDPSRLSRTAARGRSASPRGGRGRRGSVTLEPGADVPASYADDGHAGQAFTAAGSEVGTLGAIGDQDAQRELRDTDASLHSGTSRDKQTTNDHSPRDQLLDSAAAAFCGPQTPSTPSPLRKRQAHDDADDESLRLHYAAADAQRSMSERRASKEPRLSPRAAADGPGKGG